MGVSETVRIGSSGLASGAELVVVKLPLRSSASEPSSIIGLVNACRTQHDQRQSRDPLPSHAVREDSGPARAAGGGGRAAGGGGRAAGGEAQCKT